MHRRLFVIMYIHNWRDFLLF